MNTNLNNEEYPRLTPPDVVYEHKDALKKKAVVIPLYVKVVAAAAAVALLFGIFWFRSATPEQELMAELKPIEAEQVVSNPTMVLAESQAHFATPTVKPNTKPTMKPTAKPSTVPSPNTYKRAEMPLLAELKPVAAPMLIQTESQPDLWLDEDFYYASNDRLEPLEEGDESNDRSLVGRGIYKMTNGECDSFASLFGSGLRSVKTELASVETTVQSSRAQLRQRVR